MLNQHQRQLLEIGGLPLNKGPPYPFVTVLGRRIPLMAEALPDGIHGAALRAGVMAINKKSPKQRQCQAALHELIHVLDWTYGINLSHDSVRLLAAALDEVLSDPDNTEFRRWLAGQQLG